MDEPGFHARRRAEKEEREQRRQAKLGLYNGGQANAQPLSDDDDEWHHLERSYHEEHEAPPEFAQVAEEATDGTGISPQAQAQGQSSRPTLVAPLKSSYPYDQTLKRKMSPHLAVMLGPILKYDTVVNNVWHGFALVVSADRESDYSTVPKLCVEWDATGGAVEDQLRRKLRINEADSANDDPDTVHSFTVEAHKMHHYEAKDGGQTFWRFKIEIPLGEREEEIFYSVSGGVEHSFWVPAADENLNIAFHSCNGFSSGVDTKAFNGPDPLWRDILRRHEQKPIHVQIGGGDQLYCDPLTKEPEIQPWFNEKDPKVKADMPATAEVIAAIDRYYYNKYVSWFRSGAFGLSLSRIPSLFTADDHDVIDGWGSYAEELQNSPIFSAIGRAGLHWYLLFQCALDPAECTSPTLGSNVMKSVIIGGPGASKVPNPSHSFISYLGPKVQVFMLDSRSERTLERVASQTTYDRCFAALKALPDSVEQLIVLLTVPIAYPRMGAAEAILTSKFNPLTHLARTGMAMPSFVNSFDKTPELLDDLNDHWCAKHHKKERNWLVEECQKLQAQKRMRVSFLSGDVHAASVSAFHHAHKDKAPEPSLDDKYMLQVVSSAIVNTPPPPAVALAVAALGHKTHRTLYHADIGETLLPIFAHDTDGSKHHPTTVMTRRNYCAINFDEATGELVYSIQIEISQGSGTTKAYVVKSPPVKW